MRGKLAFFADLNQNVYFPSKQRASAWFSLTYWCFRKAQDAFFFFLSCQQGLLQKQMTPSEVHAWLRTCKHFVESLNLGDWPCPSSSHFVVVPTESMSVSRL